MLCLVCRSEAATHQAQEKSFPMQHTETRNNLQHVQREAMEQVAQLRRVMEIIRELASMTTMDTLLDGALHCATTFIGYDSGSILLFVHDTPTTLEICASIGPDAVAPGTRVANLETSISGYVLQHQRPLVLEGKAEHIGTVWRLYTRDIPITITLPMISATGQPVGVLTLKHTHPTTHPETSTVDVLQLLASQLAVIIQQMLDRERHASLLDDLKKREITLLDLVERIITAQEEERRRTAYDLHDGLAQIAASAYQHLQTFAVHYRTRSQKHRDELNQSLDLSRRVVTETRRVIAGLRPTVLDDFGLSSALRHEVNNLRTEKWDVDYDESLGAYRLQPQVETTLFRVAQEALNNIRKHAGTTRICLSLHVHNHAIRLEVQDWGCGFDPALLHNQTTTSNQIGLLGMQERMVMIGGTCTIHSQLGHGTLVVAQVPLPEFETERMYE